MSNKRLYEVARDHNLSSDALMAMVQRLGFDVRSHMSVASDDILEAIEQEFRQQKAELREEIEKRERKTRERKARARRAVEEEVQRRREAQDAADKIRREEEEARKAKEAAEAAAKAKAAHVPPPVTEQRTFTPTSTPEQRPARSRTPVGGITGRPGGAASPVGVRRQPLMQAAVGSAPAGRRRRSGRRRRQRVDQRDVAASFRKTIAELGTRTKSKRRQRHEAGDDAGVPEPTRTIEVNEFMSVAELAHKMGVSPTEVVAKCLELGMLATVNQRLDLDTIETIALEFDYSIQQVEEIGEEVLADDEEEIGEEAPRAPVVTIMGHVDHGKTSLLDYIRVANVVAGEKGGITQHIGAYMVDSSAGQLTFLDTPGHAAFTAMRARGAQATDIVILVVAADDAVMPQTIEAIDHAQAAEVPIVVAVNKMDLPDADIDRVKSQLSEHGLVPEDWGGKTIIVPVSAKTGMGVDKLLEMVHLQAEVLELTANPLRRARGVIIEAQLDRGRGAVATVLVQTGTLHIGDDFVTGPYCGRVRSMFNERGYAVTDAPPSAPVLVVGSDGVPQAGDTFVVCVDEQKARHISQMRGRLKRERTQQMIQKTTLTNLFERIQSGTIQELKIVIKGDVDGSVEVLADTLTKIKSDEVQVNVIHRGVGAINESDVLLAAASEAVIIGFHVRPDARARELAVQEGVDVRLYDIIYEVERDIRSALEGMLKPIEVEERTGEAKVKQVFKISKVGTIAGSDVLEGAVKPRDRVRVVRDGTTIYTGLIDSVRRFADSVKEVSAGLECGIKIVDYNDIKVGDVFELYRIVSKERKLE